MPFHAKNLPYNYQPSREYRHMHAYKLIRNRVAAAANVLAEAAGKELAIALFEANDSRQTSAGAQMLLFVGCSRLH
jgi:hypothetical protein